MLFKSLDVKNLLNKLEHCQGFGTSVVSFSFSVVVVLRKLIIHGFQEFEATSQPMV